MKFRKVPVGELIVDDRYQRPLDEKRVAKMVREYDSRRFGTLEANQRNGVAAVFDGQHRLAVAKELGMATVPCLIHTNLTAEDEASLFVALQRDRRGITQMDRFKARLFQGDPDALEIARIVEQNGYQLRRDGKNAGHLSSIQAVTSLERVYRKGVLNETLYLLGDLWRGDDKSTDGGLIDGLAIVIEGYSHRLDPDVLDRLRAVSPVTVLRRAIGNAGGGSGKGLMVAKEIRKLAGLVGAPKKRREAVAV